MAVGGIDRGYRGNAGVARYAGREETRGSTEMTRQIVALRVAAIVFGLMCLAQLTRVVVFPGVAVFVGGHRFPLWPHLVAVVVLAGLTFWMWKVSYFSHR
jgi:hypothetical protein